MDSFPPLPYPAVLQTVRLHVCTESCQMGFNVIALCTLTRQDNTIVTTETSANYCKVQGLLYHAIG